MSNSTEHIGFKSAPEWLLIFNAVLVFIIAVIGVLANVFTIFIFIKNSQIRNAAAYFIISLCSNDLIYCVIVLPLIGVQLLGNQIVSRNSFLCKFVPFLAYGNMGISFFSVVLITFDRYIKIAHTSLYNQIFKPKYTRLMIACTWMFNYGFQLPTVFGVWGNFGLDEKFLTCDILKDENGNSSKRVNYAIGFILPCIVVILCYIRILYVVKISQRRIKRHSSNNSGSTIQSKDLKGISMVAIIFVTFLVCYFPIAFIKIFDHEIEYPGLHVIGYILLYISFFTNPIIYFIMNKRYREVCNKTLQSICKKNENNVPQGSQNVSQNPAKENSSSWF